MGSKAFPVFRPEKRVEKKGISLRTLQIIAMLIMLFDNTAPIVLEKMLIARGINDLDLANKQGVQAFITENSLLYSMDMFMRLAGILSFPLFCFILIIGFQNTHNKYKFTVRLAALALISEIPFDLAFQGKVFFWSYQNVLFTLLIGLLLMIGFEFVSEKLKDKKWLPALALAGAIMIVGILTYFISSIAPSLITLWNGTESNMTFGPDNVIVLAVILSVAAILIFIVMLKKGSLQTASASFADFAVLTIGILVVELLKADYAGFGIVTIAVMYALRKKNMKCMLGGCIALTLMSFIEIMAFFALIPAYLYNGKNDSKLKYIFYAFFPVHLFLLYLISCFIV